MVKKTLLGLAIAASAVGLSGCKTGDEFSVDTTPVKAGSEGTTPSTISPVFSPANSKLPINTDFVFAAAATSDGTASTSDTTPPVTTAINDLPGFSTTATFYIEFNGALDSDTVAAGSTVFLMELKSNEDDASIDALDISSILAAAPTAPFSSDQPVAGTDYTARYVELDNGSKPAVAITPLRPLDPKTKYIVALTNGIQSVDGKAVSPSADYALARGNLGLPSSALQPVRDAVQGWEALAGSFLNTATGGSVTQENIVLSYAFTTDGSLDVLTSYANPAEFVANNLTIAEAEALTDQFAGGALDDIVARTIATGGSTDPSTLAAVNQTQIDAVKALDIYPGQLYGAIASADISSLISYPSSISLNDLVDRPAARDVSLVSAAAVDSAIGGNGASPATFLGTSDAATRFYQGEIALPNFLGAATLTTEFTAAGASAAMASDADWSANTTVGAVLDGALGNEAGSTPPTDTDDTTNVTYRYPFPQPDGDNAVNHSPVLVTMPAAVNYTGGGGMDCSGLSSVPVVIYAHGITGSRANSVAYAAGLAANCIATVAIDLPLHGIAPQRTDNNGALEANPLLPFNMEYALAADTGSPWGGVIAAQVGGGDSTFAETSERHGNIYQNSSNLRVAMEFGTTDAGTSGSTFINLSNFTRTRDNLRQAVVDLMNLNASLGNISTALDAQGAFQLDTTKVYVAGHSLGAIVATTFAAVNNSPSVLAGNTALNEIQGVILANGGADVTKLLENSPTFGPVVTGGLAAAGVEQGTSNFEKFMYVFQSAVDVADPANAGLILAETDTPVLAFNMVGGNALPSDSGELAAISYPDGFKALGQFLPDSVVPNFDYFADAGTNPYAAFASALNLPTGLDTTYAPLAGTQGLTTVLGTEQVNSATNVGDLASPLRVEARFASGTHSTFANSDHPATFYELLGQSVSFIYGSYALTNTTVLETN
ncbi:hypothetical protein [Thalassolituus sp.]|uniref:hypothetical protein n=1 Tax=Thalassolituus sp. TaxID=2030822 RepID=UPI0035163A8C